MDVLDQIISRILPAVDATPSPLQGAIALGIGLALVFLPVVWRVVRLCVTLVHELGHALVGMAVGRRFTGFVVRGDMSGHAVTSGRPTGPGRIASLWAGYPAPAVVGAAVALLATIGWSAPVITFVGVVLLVSVVRIRSGLTAVVVIVALAGTAALWWWRDDHLQTTVLLALSVVLVLGAWRHLGAVLRDRGSGSDPAVLAKLTRLPAGFWNATFVVVLLAASAAVAMAFAPTVRELADGAGLLGALGIGG